MATKAQAMLLEHLRQSMLYHEDGGITDGALLECFIGQRDEAAFAALVRRHGPMVLGVCRRVLHNEADAEDCFQATFLVLVRKAASIRPRGMVGNWLYKVAHNAALKAKAMRNQRQRKEREAAELKVRQPAEQEPELQELLDQELHALPDKYRAAIVLCDLEGKTMLAASRELGCPQGTLSARLVRGRAMLARRLTRQGLTLAAGAVAAALAQNVASAGVPLPLVTSTVKAASLFAAGQAASGAISAKVAALTEGVLKAMLMTKLKVAIRSDNGAKPCRCRRGSCLLRDIGNRANGQGKTGHGPEYGCGGFADKQLPAKADARTTRGRMVELTPKSPPARRLPKRSLPNPCRRTSSQPGRRQGPK